VDRLPTVKELKTGIPDPDHDNAVYSANGVAFEYKDHPIHLETGKSYRIYLVNMLEFDPLNNFHLHGNLFDYYPSGTSLKPEYKNDILALMQGDRGIAEFKYTYPGMYMFHSHKNEFSMKGWLGFFDVTKSSELGMKTDTPLINATTDLSSLVNINTPKIITSFSTSTHNIISKTIDTNVPGLEGT